MKSVWTVAVIAVLLALPTWAHAEEVDATKQALLQATQSAFDTGRFGEAYELSADLVARYPDDAIVRYYAGFASMRTLRNAEARAHLDAGLLVHPDSVDLLALRGSLRTVEGDDTGAKLDIARALEIDPAAAFALEMKNLIEVSDRARSRLEGKEPGLAHGSPSAFVDRLCETFADGTSPSALASFFALDFIETMPPDAHNYFALSMVVKAAMEASREDSHRARALGWFVVSEAEIDEDRHLVEVWVPMEITITETERRMFETVYADPKGRDLIDPVTRELLDGVDDSERAALFERMVGMTNRTVTLMQFEVLVADGRYLVTDVVRDGVSLKENLAAFGEMAARVDPELARKPVDIPYLAGKVVGVLLFVGLAVAVSIWLARR